MKKFVKIKITDNAGKVLEHYFVRADKWGLPGGAIEDGETPQIAAGRELLERTGYQIDPRLLTEESFDGTTYIFTAKQKDAVRVAAPGERGGYQTKVRWR